MMWEQEYYDFTKTARGGFLTKEQKESNWTRWLHDDSVLKDNDGPNGFLRIEVKTGDKVVRYGDKSISREAEGQLKSKKKADTNDVLELTSAVGRQHDSIRFLNDQCSTTGVKGYLDLAHDAITAAASSTSAHGESSCSGDASLYKKVDVKQLTRQSSGCHDPQRDDAEEDVPDGQSADDEGGRSFRTYAL